MGESVEDVEAVALRPVGGWRSGPVRALRLEASAGRHGETEKRRRGEKGRRQRTEESKDRAHSSTLKAQGETVKTFEIVEFVKWHFSKPHN
jgi:hypothetical protein